MMYPKRPHKVCEVADLATLVHKLTNYTWTTCSAFSWRSLTLLNDSTGPDGAQEYAVIRASEQIESITVSWMKPDELRELLEQYERGEGAAMHKAVTLVEHPQGYCPRCA